MLSMLNIARLLWSAEWTAFTAVMLLAAGGVQYGCCAQQQEVRFCVPSVDTAYIQKCTAALQLLNTAEVTFLCVAGSDAVDCMKMIQNGQAHISKFGGEELFKAGKDYKLDAYVSEDYGTEVGSSYYAVAVVEKAFCDAQGPDVSMADLKDKRACSTGFRKTAGWTVPIGHLVQQNIMPVIDTNDQVTNDAESFEAFFSSVCAPRTTSSGPQIGLDGKGFKWDPLCENCLGDCTEGDPYSDYLGAFRCLSEKKGDVAFVKHSTPIDYTQGGKSAQSWSTRPQSDFRLLCRSGGCKELSQYSADCGVRVPAHAVVGLRNYPQRGAVIAALAAANATSIRPARNISGADDIYAFQKDTQALKPILTTEFIDYFTSAAYNAFIGVEKLDTVQARFCTVGDAEQKFCAERAAPALNGFSLGFEFACVKRGTPGDCLRAIKANEADLRAFDGGDVYEGSRRHNLKAILAENYGTEGAAASEYFAVAVVHKDFCPGDNKITLESLRGKKACSTGYRRTAGFRMMMGLLINAGFATVVRTNSSVEDDAETAAGFFSEACIPGTSSNGPVNTADGKGANWAPMCKLCKGDCSFTTSEPYQDYPGSLRCLMEGAGDVAFTKHTTALEFTKDGSAPQAWSSKNMADLRLLCGNGGCAAVNHAFKCNLAAVPSHAVLVRVDYPDTTALKAALVAASDKPEFRSLVFSSSSNPGNFIFKSSTRSLMPINDDTNAFLGSALKAFAGLDSIRSGPATPPAPTWGPVSSKDSSLSDGAIAGIVVGVSVAALLVGAAIAFVLTRRRYVRFNTSNYIVKEQELSANKNAAANGI